MNKILQIALSQYGIKEVPGDKHNPEILKWYEATPFNGADWVTDELPNCSTFINYVMWRAGLPKTDDLAARSWLKWGQPVTDPQPGDLVIYWRNSPESWEGHAAIVVKPEPEGNWVLGANQDNMVCIKYYDNTRLLGYRRHIEPEKPKSTSEKIDQKLNEVDMNLKERIFSNWKTTVLGGIGVVLMILVGANVISEEQSEGLETATNGIIDNIEAIVASVMSVILLFSKD